MSRVVTTYMGYIGMCHCEGYGFQAVYSGIRLLLARSPQQQDANYCGPVTVPPLMRDRTPHGGLRPLLFTNSVWVLKRPTELIYTRVMRPGNGLSSSSLSEKTRKCNRLQMVLQRQHFLLSYLKTLSVGLAGT